MTSGGSNFNDFPENQLTYWVSYQVTNQAHDGIVLIYQTTSTGHRNSV